MIKTLKDENTDTLTQFLISSSVETYLYRISKRTYETLYFPRFTVPLLTLNYPTVSVCALWEQDCVETRRQIPVINVFNNVRSTLRGTIKTLPGMHRRIN